MTPALADLIPAVALTRVAQVPPQVHPRAAAVAVTQVLVIVMTCILVSASLQVCTHVVILVYFRV